MPPRPRSAARIEFGPFQLDLVAEQLRRNDRPIHLRPKTFAVLRCLAKRPGELVTKQALLDEVWGKVAISEDVVRLSVGELRAALGDNRTAARLIETVTRRGYRFVATLRTAEIRSGAVEPAIEDCSAESRIVVGRARERAEVASWFRAATTGRRQIGFVTGETGIGKTTLLDTVVRDLRGASGAQLRIARGQCVEHYGGGESFLPLLDALASLRREAEGPVVDAVLREHAPAWLLGSMGISPPGGVEPNQPAARARQDTLHRLATSLDALAAGSPLLVVLEDVQWSDYSTLDLLSVIAQRHGSAQLLVLCTLRPTDAIAGGHPVVSVKRELQRKGLVREIPLQRLSAEEVASYLAKRFSGSPLPEHLLPLLLDRSEGNPFFVVTLVDHLLERGLLREEQKRWELRGEFDALRTAIPDGLRAVIEPRLERLEVHELRVLEAASVAGPEFAAHAVAGIVPPEDALGNVETVEQLCDSLARREDIVRAAGEDDWPDGRASARYAFRHTLYQQMIYERLSSSTRRRLHQATGEQLENAYRGRTEEITSELVAHFERSGDVDRAIRFRRAAAAQARSRSAYRETCLHLRAALDLMREQPETHERLVQEMACLHDLGHALFAIEGYGETEAARVFAQLRQLAERAEGAQMRFRAMEGELAVLTMRAELTAARALAEEKLVLAEQLGDPTSIASTHVNLCAMLFMLGEVEAARQHAERGLALQDPKAPPLEADVAMLAQSLLGAICAYIGRVAQARAHSLNAVARAAELGDPFQRVYATSLAAQTCAILHDVTGARSFADETVHLASEYDLSFFRIAAALVRGWCDVGEGRVADGLAAARGAFEEFGATGQRFSTTYLSVLLGETHLALGDVASVNQVVDEALAFAAETGERAYMPELYRLKGECLLSGAATGRGKADAAEYFELAIATAVERGALLFELRAAICLCRVRRSAYERLEPLVDRFDAEDDCADLRAAFELLGARELAKRSRTLAGD